MCSQNSVASRVSFWMSSSDCSHLVPSSSPPSVLPALYSQCAATPASATRSMASVRIWNSMLMLAGPTSVVCSDW